MKKHIFLLIVIFSLFSSFIFAQDDSPILVGEYFLDADKSISILGKIVGIGNVKSTGEVYVYIDSYGEWIYPGQGFIEYEGLIVEPFETFYDSTDPRGSAASIQVYRTVTEQVKEAEKLDDNKWFFNVNEQIEYDGKIIKLLDVYEDGTVVFQVGKPTVIIFSNQERTIQDGDVTFGASLISIKNKESFYSPKKEDRAATVEIFSGIAIAESEPAPVEKIDESTTQKYPEKVQRPALECGGCLDAKNNCIPISVRIGDLYCDIDKEFKDQLRENVLCNNNYECSSNLCIDNQCIEQGLFRKILNWFRRVFG